MTAWKLVPTVPTKEMVAAGRRQMPVEQTIDCTGYRATVVPRSISDCISPAKPYAAMLDAAPDPPPYEPSDGEVEAALYAACESMGTRINAASIRAALIAAEKKRRSGP